MHAQLHLCACPTRPSCSLGWASRLSDSDSGPLRVGAPPRGGHSQAQARGAARAPPQPRGPAHRTCLGGSPGMSRPHPPPLTSHCCVFFPPDKITFWVIVASYLFMVDSPGNTAHTAPKTLQSLGTVSASSASFFPEFLAPGTGPGTDLVLRLA